MPKKKAWLTALHKAAQDKRQEMETNNKKNNQISNIPLTSSPSSTAVSLQISHQHITEAGFVYNGLTFKAPNNFARILNAYLRKLQKTNEADFRRRLRYYKSIFGSHKNLMKLYDVYGTLMPSLKQLKEVDFLNATDQNGELKAEKIFSSSVPVQRKRKSTTHYSFTLTTPNNDSSRTDGNQNQKHQKTSNKTSPSTGKRNRKQVNANQSNNQFEVQMSIDAEDSNITNIFVAAGGDDGTSPTAGPVSFINTSNEDNQMLNLAWQHAYTCSHRKRNQSSPVVSDQNVRGKGGGAKRTVFCIHCRSVIGTVEPLRVAVRLYPEGHSKHGIGGSAGATQMPLAATRRLVSQILKLSRQRSIFDINTIGMAYGNDKYYKVLELTLKHVLFLQLKFRNAIHAIEVLRKIEMNTIVDIGIMDAKWDRKLGSACIVVWMGSYSKGIEYAESIVVKTKRKGMNRVPFEDDSDVVLHALLGMVEPWAGTANAMSTVLGSEVMRKKLQSGVGVRIIQDNDDASMAIQRLEFDLQVLRNAKEGAVLLTSPQQISKYTMLHLPDCSPQCVQDNNIDTYGTLPRRRRRDVTGVGAMTGMNATSAKAKQDSVIPCLNHEARALMYNATTKMIGKTTAKKKSTTRKYTNLTLKEIEIVEPILNSYATAETIAQGLTVYNAVRKRPTDNQNSKAKKAQIEYLRTHTVLEAQQVADQRLDRLKLPSAEALSLEERKNMDDYFMNQQKSRLGMEQLERERSRLEIGINTKTIVSKRKKGGSLTGTITGVHYASMGWNRISKVIKHLDAKWDDEDFGEYAWEAYIQFVDHIQCEGPCDNCDDYCHKPGATRTCVALTDELHIAVFSLSFIRLLINFGNGKYDNGLGNHCCQNTPLEQFYSLVEHLNGDLAVGLSVWKLQCGIAELQWNAKQLRRLSKDPKYKDMLAKDFSINEHVDHVVRIHESLNLWLDQNKIDRIQKDNQTRDKQTQKQATEEGKQKKKNQKYDKKVKQRNDKAKFTREHEDKVAEQYANQLGAAAAATYESEYISQNGESAANIVAQSLLANAAPSLDSKNRRREKKKKRGTRQLQAIKLLIKEIDYFFWEYDIDPENEPLAEEIAIGYFNLYNDNIEEAIENLEKDFKKKFKEELKVDNPEDFTFLKNVLEKLNCRKRKSQVEVMDRIEEEDEQSDDQEKGLGDESSDESSDEFSDASSNESRDASRNELSDEDEVEEQCTRKCGNCSICIMKLEADTTRERTMETTMETTRGRKRKAKKTTTTKTKTTKTTTKTKTTKTKTKAKKTTKTKTKAKKTNTKKKKNISKKKKQKTNNPVIDLSKTTLFKRRRGNRNPTGKIISSFRRGEIKVSGDGNCLVRIFAVINPLSGGIAGGVTADKLMTNANIRVWLEIMATASSRKEINKIKHGCFNGPTHRSAVGLQKWNDIAANHGQPSAIGTVKNMTDKTLWASNNTAEIALRWLIMAKHHLMQMPVIIIGINATGLDNKEIQPTTVVSALYLTKSNNVSVRYGSSAAASNALGDNAVQNFDSVIISNKNNIQEKIQYCSCKKGTPCSCNFVDRPTHEETFQLKEALQICAALCPATAPCFVRFVGGCHYDGNRASVEDWNFWVEAVAKDKFEIESCDNKITWHFAPT